MTARRPDLSSLTEEQCSAVAYLAQREAATLITRVLDGANERIAQAVRQGTVEIPIFHLEDVARLRTWPSAGNPSENSRRSYLVGDQPPEVFSVATEGTDHA